MLLSIFWLMGSCFNRRQFNSSKMNPKISNGCATSIFLTIACLLLFWFKPKIEEMEATRKNDLKSQADQEPVFGNLEEEKRLFAYERQQKRLETLEKFCERNPSLKKKSLSNLVSNYGKRFSVLSDHRIFECRVAKSGTTYRAYVLWNAFHPNQTFYHKNFQHPVVDEQIERLTSSNYQQVASSYKGYMFTREPIMRIISSYFNKFCDSASVQLMYRKALKQNLDRNPTLGQVFKYLSTNDALMSDSHFNGFFDVCAPCTLKYKFIGRLETMTDDLVYLVYNKTRLWKHFNLNHVSSKIASSQSCPLKLGDPKIFHDVNIEDVKKIIERRKFEYEAFGYDPSFIVDYILRRIAMSKFNE